MKFGFALESIKTNTKLGMRLPYWSPEVYVTVESVATISHPVLVVHSRHGTCVWKESYPEMWRDDWIVLPIIQLISPNSIHQVDKNVV